LLGWRLLDAVDVTHQELAFGAAQDLADVDALAVSFQERSANARGYLLTADPVFLEARNTATEAFEARLATVRRRHAGTEREADLTRMTQLWRRLDAASDRAMEAVDRDREAGITIWEDEARPLQSGLSAEMSSMVASQRARFRAARADAHDTTARGRLALGALAAVLAAVLAALLWRLARTADQVMKLVAKEQEQTMFRVLDQVPVGVFVLDSKGKPYYANQWSRRLLGRSEHDRTTPQQLAATFNAFEAGTDKLYPSERTPILRALRGESSEVTDMELRRAGDVVPLHVRGAPIHDAEGNLAYAVAAFQDVRELHEAATRDPLTGLGNRRSLAQTFVRERLLQERAGGGLWLAVLDLDHFKRVNDEHGHAMGDAVLKRTAATLVRVLRRTDVVVRWGGEELVVVLPNVNLDGALAALEKAHSAVRSESFSSAEHVAFHVSFSAGLVRVRQHETLDSAVARADALLYAAKRAGRDRILSDGSDAEDGAPTT
jgi:diguanylate cyclase (GGDEF)-like protein/PAS domain S-box-containing protein